MLILAGNILPQSLDRPIDKQTGPIRRTTKGNAMQNDASTAQQRHQQNARIAAGHDQLQKVAGYMAKHMIGGLPRNYELVHEALNGHHPALARGLAALGQRPSQHDLDQLGLKHRLLGHCGIAEERLQADATGLLDKLGEHVSLGILHKQTFARALETILKSIREDEGRGVGDLIAELDFLNGATSDLLHSETELGLKLKTGLQQIETAKRAVETAKAATEKDRLTGLPNRLAFIKRLEDLYGHDVPPTGHALLLVDIDDFRSINHQYGEEAGNRLLQRLATIFRKTIKKNDVVARIDGDDFAFLFSDVAAEDAHAIADRLHAAVENNLVFATEHGSTHGGLGLSIGFALTHDADEPMQLLAHAEAALNTARANPRAPIAGYPPERSRPAGRHVA